MNKHIRISFASFMTLVSLMGTCKTVQASFEQVAAPSEETKFTHLSLQSTRAAEGLEVIPNTVIATSIAPHLCAYSAVFLERTSKRLYLAMRWQNRGNPKFSWPDVMKRLESSEGKKDDKDTESIKMILKELRSQKMEQQEPENKSNNNT